MLASILPSIVVILLLVVLVVVWVRSSARIYGLEEDLDAAHDAAEAHVVDLLAIIAQKDAAIRRLDEQLAGAVANMVPRAPSQYKPKHRRPWPTPDLKHHSDLAADIWTPTRERLALARLAMDCALFHPADCDCYATGALLLDLAAEHESAPEEGA